jgi:hypothetical protein
MPTIEGSVEESGRVIVVDETTGAIDSNTTVSSGTYSVSSSSLDPKIVLFRRASDGHTLGYSGITSLDDSPFLGEATTFVDGTSIKLYGNPAGTMIGGSKFIFIFRNQTPQVPYYTIGTISGQSVSFTEPAALLSGLVYGDLYYDSTYDKILQVTDTQYRVCSLSGNNITQDSITNFSTVPCFTPYSSYTYQISSTYYNQDTHQLLVLYIRIPDYSSKNNQDTIYCYLRAVVGTFDGTSFSFGNYIDITGFTTFWYYRNIYSIICHYPETGGYCISYCRMGSGYTPSITMLEVNESTITKPYSTNSTGSSVSSNRLGLCYDADRSMFFLSVSSNSRVRIIPYGYNNGVLSMSSYYEIISQYNSSVKPILDYDLASSKILLANDYYSSGYSSRYRTFTYSVATGVSFGGAVEYESNSGYPCNIFLRDPDTGKRVIVYSSTPDYLGKAKVFRL